jgi:hypothetical protein
MITTNIKKMKTKLFFCLLLLLSFQLTISYGQKPVKKITVSGSSAAIYGMRGSNGVIVIDLLKGPNK